MYKGIKRKRPEIKLQKVNNKEQLLQTEEVENNGFISQQYVFKTKKYERNKAITWKDFEICNLKLAGIDPNTLPSTILPADIDKLSAKAAACEMELDEIQIISNIENEQQNAQNNEPATE